MIYRRLRVFYVLAFVLMTQVPFIAQAANGFDPIDGSQLRSGLEQGMSCVFPLSVGTYDELKAAVNCFNTQTGDGSYTIELNSDILLTDYLPIIKNTNSNTLLVIEGNGYSLSGGGTLPSGGSISSETNVTVQNVTFKNGNGGFASAIYIGFPSSSYVGTLTIINVSFLDNYPASGLVGSAIKNNASHLIVINSIFDNNGSHGAYGGAIFTTGPSSLIIDSIFTNNRGFYGGALYLNGGINTLDRIIVRGNRSDYGGGIAHANGSLKLTSSAIVENYAFRNGGGLYGSNFNVFNTTISGNEGGVGGIFFNGGINTVTSSTIANNTQFSFWPSDDLVQSIAVSDAGNLTISNSIVVSAGRNCSSSITSNGHNIISDLTCGTATTGDQFNTNPFIDTLGDNGGSTLTHALLPNSPAIDGGNSSLIPIDITTDQRGIGFSRIMDAAVDVGAFEASIQPAIKLSPTSINVVEDGVSDTYTAVLNAQPTADVTVTITSDTQVTTNLVALTFTPADWNIPQSVTVMAVDDSMTENMHTSVISHTAISSDTNYNDITIASVTVTIGDNDIPALITSISTADLTEGGEAVTYTLVLGSQPTSDVRIDVYSFGEEISVIPRYITFSPTGANAWNIPQTIRIQAVDDDDFEGFETEVIYHDVETTTDEDYRWLYTTFTVNLTDNDQPTNLIANAGFEYFSEAPKLPAFWVGRSLTRYDRRLCTSQATFSGSCGFQFKPDGNPMTASRELRQRNASIPWSANHEVLVFSAQVRANNVPSGARVMIVVHYNDGSGRVDRLVVPIEGGTYGYSEIGSTLELYTGSISHIVTRIRVGNRAGRLRIDDLFLALVPASTLDTVGDEPRSEEGLFTLPEAPNDPSGEN